LASRINSQNERKRQGCGTRSTPSTKKRRGDSKSIKKPDWQKGNRVCRQKDEASDGGWVLGKGWILRGEFSDSYQKGSASVPVRLVTNWEYPQEGQGPWRTPHKTGTKTAGGG